MSNHTQNGPPQSVGYALGEPHAPSGGLSGWGVVLAACGLVATGHLLGVAWLSEWVLGAPAGLWLVAFAVGIFHAPTRKALAGGLERLWELFEHSAPAAALEGAEPAEHLETPNGWWPQSSVGGVWVDAVTRALACVVRVAWMPIGSGELSVAANLRRRLERWLGGLALPTRPLRVGLCMPDEESRALVAARGDCRVEWYRMPSWEDPQSACRKHLFDAVVFHEGEGPVRLVTLERPGCTAGVVEWADLGGELTFGTLFPSRVDPAAVVIEGATRTRVREGADLLRALVEAAATLARSEPRLTLADRMLGRHATDVVARPAGLSLWKSPRSVAAGVMTHLVRTAAAQAEAWPEAAAIAADVGSAFFVAVPDMTPSARREGLLTATECITSGAATALRVGSSCIGALEDDEGMAWLVRADAMLRDGSSPLAKLDHAAFLESELVHGSENPMSVGRAAAGICLVCAAADPERVRFLRDDMLEEMAYAGWLVGRDQDRGVLIRVFLEIERAHAPAPSKPKAARKPRSPQTKAGPAKAKPAKPKATKSKPAKSRATGAKVTRSKAA